MHIHKHRGWYYVINGNGDVLHKALYSFAAAKWTRDNYGIELALSEETEK